MLNKLSPFAFFVLIFIFFTHPFEGSGDFYHHLNTGAFIAKNHQLPTTDIWTHTQLNQPWIAHSWGSGLLFYLLFSHFGEISIALWASIMAVLTFTLLYILLRSYSVPKLPAILAMATIIPAVASRWPQRPELFEYPLILSLLIIDAKKDTYPKLPWLYPLIILFWANFYGSSVLFGLLLIGFLILKQLFIDKFKIKPNQKLFYPLSLISYPLSLINGYGLNTLFYFYLYIPKIATYEGEWAGILRITRDMPPSQLVTIQYSILIYFVYLVLLAVLAILSLRLFKKHFFPMVLGLAILAPILVFRNLPLSAILSALALALMLAYQIKKRHFWVLSLPILATIFMFGISLWINPPKLSPSENKPASQMVEFIRSHGLRGKALNMGHFGGFLTYKLYPDLLVFFDTRDDLFTGSKILADLYQTYNNSLSVIPLIHKYKVDLVIADTLTDGLNYRDLFYSLDWSLVFLSDRYFIMVPTKLAQEKGLISLTFLDPFSTSAAKPGHEQAALKYYQALVDQDPASLTNKLYLSSTLLALKDFDQVIARSLALQVDKSSPVGPAMEHDRDILLADAYLEKNDCQNGKTYLDLAMKPIRPVLILGGNSRQISQPTKQLAKYFLICQKDQAQARTYLNEFLHSTQASPLEKIEFEKQFQLLLSP